MVFAISNGDGLVLLERVQAVSRPMGEGIILKIEIAAITHQHTINIGILLQESQVDEVTEIKEVQDSPGNEVAQPLGLGYGESGAPQPPGLSQPLSDVFRQKPKPFDLDCCIEELAFRCFIHKGAEEDGAARETCLP